MIRCGKKTIFSLFKSREDGELMTQRGLHSFNYISAVLVFIVSRSFWNKMSRVF